MILDNLLDFLYPPYCVACGVLLPGGGKRRVCDLCISRIARISEPFCLICGAPALKSALDRAGRCPRCQKSQPNFRTARSAARYTPHMDEEEGTIGSIIRRHKYGLDQSLGRALAECIGELPFGRGVYDTVIPVPLHRRRLRWRGFNQAALLGLEIARRLDCPCDLRALARIRPTPPQTFRNHRARAHNVRGAFTVTEPRRVGGKRLLLVDDVMTTGATADECARILRAGGAGAVDVFTLARVL
ncbi:MAG: double zinc ribbon domain-containing protein [Candidatus Binataceae bacterium]